MNARIDGAPQASEPVTPELLDQLAAELGLSDTARTAVDETISVVLFGLNTATDAIVHNREGSEEHSDVPRPAQPQGKFTAYIAAHVVHRLTFGGERAIDVPPKH